jgi:hypothetical protein
VSLAGGPLNGGDVPVEVAVTVTVTVVAGIVEEVFVGDVGGPGEGMGHLWWMLIEVMDGIGGNGRMLASLKDGEMWEVFLEQ